MPYPFRWDGRFGGGSLRNDMAIALERWAVTERQFIEDEIKWLKAGAKLFSPSGTTSALENLTSWNLDWKACKTRWRTRSRSAVDAGQDRVLDQVQPLVTLAVGGFL